MQAVSVKLPHMPGDRSYHWQDERENLRRQIHLGSVKLNCVRVSLAEDKLVMRVEGREVERTGE